MMLKLPSPQGMDHGTLESIAWPAASIVQRLSAAMQVHVQMPLELALARLRSASASLREGIQPPSRLASESPAALTTLLATDLEDFTSTLERLGDARAQRLMHTHNQLLRACIKGHRGREVTHLGDGILAAFQSAENGLRCAVSMQRCLREHNRRQPTLALRMRIGLHAGVPLPEEDRLFGTCVNMTARVCAAAEGERILASAAVLQLIERPQFNFADCGVFRLKGIAAPVRLHELDWQPEARAVASEPQLASQLN